MVWVLNIFAPITVILSQKILFEARKMGTFWEASGKPNFSPIVYNMGSPLFVWGWFLFWLGSCGIPIYKELLDSASSSTGVDLGEANATFPGNDIYAQESPSIPLFLNVRTLLAFVAGCGMVPVVGFLDYSHDLDGPWLGENTEGKVFGKWWLGTDGTYFGVFLESPWPFVVMWSLFGFSSFFGYDDTFDIGWQEILILVNCVLQGIDAGILIQANLYAGNMEGKNNFCKPFVLLFLLLAINIGSKWGWIALALSLPGTILIILGQKTVFGARRRGDHTMQNAGKANPYNKVYVYSWGEVFFMIGWILICWGASMPSQLA